MKTMMALPSFNLVLKTASLLTVVYPAAFSPHFLSHTYTHTYTHTHLEDFLFLFYKNKFILTVFCFFI
jgi:hypothetical protein